jgi:hypothetical protein
MSLFSAETLTARSFFGYILKQRRRSTLHCVETHFELVGDFTENPPFGRVVFIALVQRLLRVFRSVAWCPNTAGRELINRVGPP